MKNDALFYYLHDKKNVGKSDSVLNSFCFDE
jgi:hypothetical protein